jgi:Predicted transcriptional regulators
MMFPKKLNETRKLRGITAKKMADSLNMQIRGYRKYESGDSSPSLESLVKIADILDVSIDYLLGRTEDSGI